LGITFKFWENLVLRFLKDPNFHDEEIWDAITEGPGGLDMVDFMEKENFYLTLTMVLKKEEWCFYEESVQEGFLPYNENRDYTDILYPVRRFCNPTYRFANDRTDFMVFDDIFDLELQAGFGLSECTFHEPKEFRGSHVRTRSCPSIRAGASPPDAYRLRCIRCTTSSGLPNMPMHASIARSLQIAPYAILLSGTCQRITALITIQLSLCIQGGRFRTGRRRTFICTLPLSSSLSATGCTSRDLPKESSLFISLSSTIWCSMI
jgi:hypothetical protein